jgi:hypothetical protein
VNGVQGAGAQVDGMDRQQMRSLADSLRNKWKSAVVVLASGEDGNVSIVAAVTKDLTAKVQAGKLVGAWRRPSAARAAAGPTWRKAAARMPAALPRRARERLSRGRKQASRDANRFDAPSSSSAPGPPASPAASNCSARREDRARRKGLRGQFALQLPDQHDVLHHAGAARNRQHPDDQPQRKAQPHRGAQVLPARGRPLQAGHPPVRARGTHRRRRWRVSKVLPPTASAARTLSRAKSCWRPATTTYRILLNVPGEDLDKVLHYYKEPHPYYNHDVAVIGAKNSAAIAALELYWTGARVTLIHRGRRFPSHVKYWIKPNIENRIKSGEIRPTFHSRVVEILPDSIRVATPEGEIESVSVKNDFVDGLP